MEKRRDMGKQSNCQQNGILSMNSMCMGKRDRSQSFYWQDDTIHEMGKRFQTESLIKITSNPYRQLAIATSITSKTLLTTSRFTTNANSHYSIPGKRLIPPDRRNTKPVHLTRTHIADRNKRHPNSITLVPFGPVRNHRPPRHVMFRITTATGNQPQCPLYTPDQSQNHQSVAIA
jgi:hypothetical protein